MPKGEQVRKVARGKSESEMSKLGCSIVIVALALGACSKSAEPSAEDLKALASACAADGCKDFKKASCLAVGGDLNIPEEIIYKCIFSYTAAGGSKTDQGCFNRPGKDRQWERRTFPGC